MNQSNDNQQQTPGAEPGMSNLAKAGVAAAAATALSQTSTANPGGGAPTVLVQLYLRGGADGLTLCAPVDEPNYQTRRDETRVYAEGDASAPSGRNGTNIEPMQQDGLSGAMIRTGFDLAPAFAPMKTLYDNGQLAFVHGAGSVDPTRSHFAQQANTEIGETALSAPKLGTGWIGRYLMKAPPRGDGSLRALGLNRFAIQSYSGGGGVIPTQEPETFMLPIGLGTGTALESIYAASTNSVQGTLTNDLSSISKLMSVNWGDPVPGRYPVSTLGDHLWRAFQVIRDDADIEVISIDYDNIDGKRWDSHEEQGVFDGTLHDLMEDLAHGLTGFQEDVDTNLTGKRVVVLVYTEFGRTLKENGGRGTDHGRGGVAMVVGNEVRIPQVYTDPNLWDGLNDASLDPPNDGDQAVTVDIRDVQGEIMAQRMGVPAKRIFPDTNYTYQSRNLLS